MRRLFGIALKNGEIHIKNAIFELVRFMHIISVPTQQCRGVGTLEVFMNAVNEVKIETLLNKIIPEFEGQLPASREDIVEEAKSRLSTNGITGLLVHCGTYTPESSFDQITDEDIEIALQCWLYAWQGDPEVGAGLWGSL